MPETGTGSHEADVIETFKAQSALVVAAVTALDAMPSALDALTACLASSAVKPLVGHVDRLYGLVESAAVGADNLLATPPKPSKELVLRAIGRQPSGTVGLRTIAIDREGLALTGLIGPEPHTLDQVADAICAVVAGTGRRAVAADAIAEMGTAVRTATSRLSIAKARLDLQASFLSSVVDADPRSPGVRLESHLDHVGARDLAETTRRLLSGRWLKTAIGNRNIVTSLLETGRASQG